MLICVLFQKSPIELGCYQTHILFVQSLPCIVFSHYERTEN